MGEETGKKSELPWYCKTNMDQIAVLIERSNHQGEAQIRLEKDIDGINTKIARIEGKIDAMTVEIKQPLLNKKQIGGLVSAIIIIARIAGAVFDRLGW